MQVPVQPEGHQHGATVLRRQVDLREPPIAWLTSRRTSAPPQSGGMSAQRATARPIRLCTSGRCSRGPGAGW
ncbi:hypothetical protein [Kutzneria kofuensis]|uniref:hypothetical protein n=1 Tax=Kutzneria kofuensis TaxID=103725 RepID=UPI0031F0B73A